ncbi:hypothetical protein NBRC111893_82 [Lentilactobacillus kosonis]|uniref:Uncharacterized protein n=1 Tax=Lentilactobacillus kosonis TaxID=2810561 RepID=A0A401FI19_9LACO|nr:hypothetical protein NBRC111893_82 [Lentilactobacillus kosonis]
MVIAKMQRLNATIPDASLNNDSLAKVPITDEGTSSSEVIEVTATESVGVIIAPRTNANGNDNAGMNICVTNPTTTMVINDNQTDIDNVGRSHEQVAEYLYADLR